MRAKIWSVLSLAVLTAALAQTESVTPQPSEPTESEIRASQNEFLTLFRGLEEGAAVDWKNAIDSAFAFGVKYPASDWALRQASMVMYQFEGAHSLAESLALWHRFAASPSPAVAQAAQSKIEVLSRLSEPVDLKFTALGGEEVDLKKLRGKVVLMDFWATWCRPCMAEMPNVKKVYAAYRDRGFEIIGVSCDFTVDQAGKFPARVAKTGPEVLEFCRVNEMPWPQHYEGRKHGDGGHKLAKQFAVFGIPAAFLLDQSGRVVALNLKGERLESEVKRLLGL